MTGNRKEKKMIDSAIKEYEKHLEEYFDNFDSEDADLDFLDELPFN